MIQNHIGFVRMWMMRYAGRVPVPGINTRKDNTLVLKAGIQSLKKRLLMMIRMMT